MTLSVHTDLKYYIDKSIFSHKDRRPGAIIMYYCLPET